LANNIIIFEHPQVVEVVLQRTGAPFEVMAELWDFFRRPDRLNASFKARSATLGQYQFYGSGIPDPGSASKNFNPKNGF
jgi:hypothetical protein